MTDSNPAFPELDADEIASIARHASARHFDDGESLFDVGSTADTFFVVLTGEVEILDTSGEEPRRVVLHKANEFTGDIDLLSHRRSVVSAIARGSVDALEVSPSDIHMIITEEPSLGDKLLRAFIARREQLIDSGFTGVRIIGSASSRDAYRIRDFLVRNRVPVTWIDVDDDPHAAETLKHFSVQENALPVVVCEGQPLLRNPSTRELAEALGLRRSFGDEVYDLIIVGAGPSGLGAAVYAASEGLSTLLLDSEAPGGQAGASSNIENYLGFPMGITGADLTGNATLQAQKFGARFSTPSSAADLHDDGDNIVITLSDGESATARSVLIATGADYCKLNVPGREQFEGLGVYYSATLTEISTCATSDVVVVGAGNSAGQAVMFLAKHTRKVIMLVRGDDLNTSMSLYLADRIRANDNIEILYHTSITQMEGTERLERIKIENSQTGERRTLETPAVFTFIGAVPHTGWLRGKIAMDSKGFICTGRSVTRSENWKPDRWPYLLETSHPGVFAAGDARLGSVKRVAAAVGEGSMAVTFVHEYLAESRPSTASL